MSNKLTPEQRIEAYEYALKQVGNPSRDGMCKSLVGITGVNIYGLATLLPEFGMFCSEYGMGHYWFNFSKEGNIGRCIILLLCIEMAKDAKN